MPRGKKEEFKIELRLDRHQKKIWESLTQEADAINELARSRLLEQHRNSWSVHRDLFIAMMEKELQKKYLLPESVRSVLEFTCEGFRPEVETRRGRRIYPLDVSPQDVVFSITENFVSVPYLGLIRYSPNKKIPTKPTSANKHWRWPDVKRMTLTIWNQLHVLLINCGKEDRIKPTRKRPKGTTTELLKDVV
jgi:hypothetical protein